MKVRSILCVAVAMVVLVFARAAPAQSQANAIEELSRLRHVLDSTGFTGTVLVYDLKDDKYAAIGSAAADRGRIPASTFKIFNALVALEAGVVVDETSVIKWDGVVRDRTELNRDRDLASAFRLSAVPHFQHLARSVGSAQMQHWVDRVGYGNRDLSGGLDRFWLSGGLRVSPRDQIRLLVRLYRSELPFSERTMATVRRIMEVERTATTVIRAKTGWAVMPDGQNVGWWIGWVEREGKEPYFFASVIEHPKDASTFGAARTGVPRAVLQALGVLAPPA